MFTTDSDQTITIFHIHRSRNEFVCLHPFGDSRNAIVLAEKSTLQGLFGREPAVESLHGLRADLHKGIDEAVAKEVNESKFLPRFLAASVVFSVAYVFFTAVVRDPIPVLDELLLALVPAVLVYRRLGRVFRKSRETTERRDSLRSRIDATVFVESPFVSSVELVLRSFDAMPVEMVFRDVTTRSVSRSLVPGRHFKEAREMLRYLEPRFQGVRFRRWRRRILRHRGKVLSSREVSAIEHWIERKSVDIPLYALYLVLFSGIHEQNTEDKPERSSSERSREGGGIGSRRRS